MTKRKLTKILGTALLGVTVITAVAPMAANAAWKQNNTGWWYTEGNSWATSWRKIDGVWYYFDGNGYMKTGWVKDNGTWYFMDSSGAMRTGWVKDNGIWYYLEGSGAMKTGWLNDNGTWYYLESSGAMRTGWLKDGGYWYFLKASGAMASDEGLEIAGERYWFFRGGQMRTGWAPHGELGTCYYQEDGAMARNCWKDISGERYYFLDNGTTATGGYEIDGVEYLFDSEGKLLRNYKTEDLSTDENGKLLESAATKARNAVLANDSKFIKSVNGIVIQPETTTIKEALKNVGDYDIKDEKCYLLAMEENTTSSDYLSVCYYLVGAESGKIYCAGNQGSMKIYEIKDNQKVNSYVDRNEGGSTTDWR